MRRIFRPRRKPMDLGKSGLEEGKLGVHGTRPLCRQAGR